MEAGNPKTAHCENTRNSIDFSNNRDASKSRHESNGVKASNNRHESKTKVCREGYFLLPYNE